MSRSEDFFVPVSVWDAFLERKAQIRGAVEFASVGVPVFLAGGRCDVRLSVRVCVRVCARMCPRPLLTVLRWFRPQCGSDCGFESGCHGVGAGGAVRCSPVGCDLMMGQHLPLLPAAPAAASAHSELNAHFRTAPSK